MEDVDEIFGLFGIGEFVEETDGDIEMDEERAERFLSNFPRGLSRLDIRQPSKKP
ncbi:hypothetical protein [Halorubrum distributum]|uniref:Uncharacterized protein n=1 Tax=Halorubrum distributum TaxID=29283 RepID=A0A6B1IRZ3_9EURY|nr:hypothetical protein [Halorubrum terrestre]MYL68932.1 hypothetical protein [Halorubrum terrestre]